MRKVKNRLYSKVWYTDIRETFNGFGNAIEYLVRYTHRIAIINTRILNVTSQQATFTVKDYNNNACLKEVTLSCKEFIRRFMIHVLPFGFQKIRYYGFLNNHSNLKNLKHIFKVQEYQRFKPLYQSLSIDELLKHLWIVDICICPDCGCNSIYFQSFIVVMKHHIQSNSVFNSCSECDASLKNLA